MKVPEEGEGSSAEAPAMIYLPLLNPASGSTDWSARILRSTLEDLQANGPAWKFYDVRLISDNLEGPTVVFEGLQRAGFSQALCYSRSPSVRYVSETESVPQRDRLVFMVFIAATGDHTILDWEWRREDEGRHGYPRGWRHDFARQVWPTTP